mgnify:CR=1 FL=1
MIRIAGVNLPPKKRIEVALTYIYGIGRPLSIRILENLGIDRNLKTDALDAKAENKLRDFIEKNQKVEGDLRRSRALNIKRLKEIGSYRGSRHAKGLPSRGQRTRRNTRTLRGNRRDRSVGSGRRPAAEKT